jgi:hypothetical protein
MKPLIIIAVFVIGVGISAALFNKNVIPKHDAIDSFCVGLKPIKSILNNNTISFKGDTYHSEFYPISRFYLLPIHLDLYTQSNSADTLLTVELTQSSDSTINSILQNRKIIHSSSANGYIYKLSTR